ncbi:MAG TPA: HAMP domain-containing sensor histidine kinase [Thermoanaerobaculia bacterium]
MVPPSMDERTPAATLLAERILVFTPTADDGPLIAQVLEERGHTVQIAGGLAALARELEAGAGVVLLASEAFEDTDALAVLREVLDRQASWSEIPILILGGSVDGSSFPLTGLLGSSAQLVLLERPLGIATFLSATEAALRSRRRQYQVERLLDELAASAVEIARAAEEATRAKDEFLATLGHELRSPMTAIRGWIEMLKAGDLGPDDAAMALSMIESSTKVQAHIVEDLMDVSKIIAGKIMIAPALVELTPLVRNVVATFLPAAAQHDIGLTVDVPSEPLYAWADDSRFQQVGWNLISNAIKFTPAGGSVHVSLVRDGNLAVMRVRDNGEGMSAELLPHVFERYRQAEGGTAKAHGGLGLGLAIVRHLVESHGGTIEAFSEGLGKGSEFVVSLPLHPGGPAD